MSSTLRRVVGGLFSVTLYLAVLPACDDSEGGGRYIPNFSSTNPDLRGRGANPQPIANLYYAFRAKKDGAGGNARPRRQIWAPFRLELHLGDLSVKQVPWGAGVASVSLADPAFLGFDFHEVEVSRSGSDLTVTASSQPGNVVHPAVVLDGTSVAVLALEHDGDELIFEVRAPLDASFQEVGRTPTAYTGPYRGSFDVRDFPKKAEAGVDDLLVLAAADPPDLTTPTKRGLESTHLAFEELLLAAFHLDFGVADGPSATAALAQALTHVDDAVTELGAVADTKKAVKNLGKAAKKLGATQKKIDKGKPEAAVKQLRKALLKADAAADQVPFEP